MEYGFIVALVVIAMFAALAALAGTTREIWDNVAENVAAASS